MARNTKTLDSVAKNLTSAKIKAGAVAESKMQSTRMRVVLWPFGCCGQLGAIAALLAGSLHGSLPEVTQ